MVCDSLESAHAAVVQLVEDFAASEAHYLSPGYSEAQARISFIDKFWMALGWDVQHEHQKNPYAQEVKVEDPQKIQGSQRRADYAFHFAPNFRDARFFCEAKKPATDLNTNADAAFQTVRYGWSAQTPLAVLTDFEQVHILDCRAKPDIQTALQRIHRAFHYKDWLKQEKFAEFYYLFSREAFTSGGFDAYVSKLPKPRKVGKQLGLLRTGAQPVDVAFLDDLEGYRETLAKLLKAADHSLDGETLTELVQRTLDRLVFLRFLEDKLIETEIQVHHFSRAAGGHAWAKFLAACRKLDTRYNGIVFKQHPILDAPGRLPIDDARFADLCEELSHTHSPYDFNAIPIHILGSIYERFLGKVIVTTEQRARVEEKPEVRKAGGVYYTPEYIVRYICEQTVGRLIEGKSPAQIAKMRFADIACGSGSFLLGVYDLLLHAHGTWYNSHPDAALKEDLAPPDKSKKRKKESIPAVVESEGVLRLTLEKRRDILLNNIFGVDLDPQAVEVAQLSLYLKLLEDETTASAAQHYLDFHEALLPSLGRNVVRGNSLIGTDILFGQFEFSAQEERKLAPMDFQSAFPGVFPSGWKGGSSRVEETPFGDYIEVGPGEPIRDLEHFKLLGGETPRESAAKQKTESEGEHFGFDAIVGNPPYIPIESMRVFERTYFQKHYPELERKYDSSVIFILKALKLLNENGRIGYISSVTWQTGENFSRLRKTMFARHGVAEIVNLPFDVFADAYVDTGLYILTGRRVPSYDIYLFPKKVKIDALDNIPFVKVPTELITEPAYRVVLNPAAQTILLRSAQAASFITLGELTKSTQGLAANRFKRDATPISKKWFPFGEKAQVRRYAFEIAETTYTEMSPFPSLTQFYQAEPKLLIRRVINRQDRLVITRFDKQMVFKKDINPFVVIDSRLSPDFLLGVLNSKLISWLYVNTSAIATKDDFRQTTLAELRRLPIPKLDLAKPAEKKQHDRMVQLVEEMLSTQQQLAAATSENDRTYYESKAAGLDRQIDELTCDLYGLTAEERALVEC